MAASLEKKKFSGKKKIGDERAKVQNLQMGEAGKGEAELFLAICSISRDFGI